MRTELIPGVLALLLLTGCGSGPQTTTGRVSDVAGRLCVQTNSDDGTCFGVTREQLAQVQLGTCVQITYTASQGLVPEASDVRVVPPPCFSDRS